LNNAFRESNVLWFVDVYLFVGDFSPSDAEISSQECNDAFSTMEQNRSTVLIKTVVVLLVEKNSVSMLKDSSAKTQQPIGKYGFMPDRFDGGTVETTVITPGSFQSPLGFAVTCIHILTWVLAAILIGTWNNQEMDKLNTKSNGTMSNSSTDVTDSHKTLNVVYWVLIIGILLVAVLHSMFARNEKTEQIRASLISVLLLTLVLLDFSIGCANVALAASSSSTDYYAAAVTCQLLVSAGTAMILSFLVNWSHNGNVAALREMLNGQGPAAS